MSLSARRAWIEISTWPAMVYCVWVALRKESVDRNHLKTDIAFCSRVALRKESVDRNGLGAVICNRPNKVALRKESVDRNCTHAANTCPWCMSLSARRAWIEIAGW